MDDELITDLPEIERGSAAKERENLDFREFIRFQSELSDRRLNVIVQETTAQVWRHIDCRTCANCCKTRHPLFSREEVVRIADYLGTTVEALRAQYLVADWETRKYTTQTLPCPFLKDNLCTIYVVRPASCSGYPHLERNFRSRLWQTIDNAATCPIVYNVLERLKGRLGFRRVGGEEGERDPQ